MGKDGIIGLCQDTADHGSDQTEAEQFSDLITHLLRPLSSVYAGSGRYLPLRTLPVP